MEYLDDRKYLSPSDNEAEKVFRCFLCKDWIYEGDKYYLISGLEYCEGCVEEKPQNIMTWKITHQTLNN